MYSPISPSELTTLIGEADLAARRLHRKLVLPAVDIDDLRQDLLVDLICRLPAYDARRGTIGAFANIVLRNQSSRIAMRIMRDRRVQGGFMLSLDAPASTEDLRPLSETIAQADGLATWHGQTPDAEAAFDDRASLSSAMGHLPACDRCLCAALAHRPVSALVAEGVGSRSALYRRIADLRFVLTAHGVGPRWDDLAAA